MELHPNSPRSGLGIRRNVSGIPGLEVFFGEVSTWTVSTSWGLFEMVGMFFMFILCGTFVVSQAAFKKDVRRVCVILLSPKKQQICSWK